MSDVATSMGTGLVAERTATARPGAGQDGKDASETSEDAQTMDAQVSDAQVSDVKARLESALARLENALHEKAERDLATGSDPADGGLKNGGVSAELQRRLDVLTTENDRLQRKHQLLGERLDATIDRIKRLMQG
ncbi:hypothetical protein [Varunaivibrio sulfuroxidans]|uniref:Uncharacterized protein n=1 Tax=Varunaivibrio sulfuroxidans TaxID=1773489 RepID=A0A4R3JEP1_9PROT|nr:hypothetical protein [Varunaivibrio sulfuroxidans]TCS63140.1 hypothetical protein EDD55_104233 [Varunaivibrio sulfuroxidans]WES31793.1 hypothetical protein P3M64_05400 [Varunaivibrio sulfuroxidans]